MSVAITKLGTDFREFRKETDGIRRAERIASHSRIFIAKFCRCFRRNTDRVYDKAKWILSKPVLMVLSAYGIWHAWRTGKLNEVIEWLVKFWTL